jgi:4-hydroxy-3-methylbut-2-enyl diphosphate reductase
LREIGEEAKKPSYLVADGSELQVEWFDGAKIVGLTAGASAPEVLVEDVIAALKRFGPVEVESLDGRTETVEFRLPPELADRRTGARAVKPEVKTAAQA